MLQNLFRPASTLEYFTQDLGNGIEIEMAAIQAGFFVMGSPPEEPERFGYELPQHTVRLSPFFMSKYPVTQAQWQVVAAFSRVNRELNPIPSYFQGANRPVEQVSWYDAVEFCDRLSHYTGHIYCLPSEAQWEYACRAGTTTPFHFGETITTAQANYCGLDRNCMGEILRGNYNHGPHGEFRQQTTPVGTFAPNAFELYDMHGLVFEWCLDYWHSCYRGAPSNGYAWLNLDNNERRRVLRGGSWLTDPAICRSANRYKSDANTTDYSIGFRIVLTHS
jgi:formylglycine-generating enzyme required for sulfatase activity